jgi:creatinine amidohydrolase
VKSQKFEELSASEFAEAMTEKPLVYVPIGSLEFHGRHLPLGMDTIHAYAFCLHVARRTGGVVLPPSYWGAVGRDGWKGSLLVSEATRNAVIRDVFRLLAEQGVKLIVSVTGHYPEVQGEAIIKLAREAMEQNPSVRILALDPFTTNPSDTRPDHGGKKETSLMLAIRPELVNMSELSAADAFEGIWKDAVEGTAEFGRAYFEASAENCASMVQQTFQAQVSAAVPGA